MTAIDFSPENVKGFTKKMAKAEKGIRGLLEDLEKDVKEVEPHWGGDSQQQFQRFYRDWRKGMDTYLAALEKTGRQLAEMAEKMPRIK